MTPAELSVAFFLQMFFVLAACRAVGWVARRCGQPQVIGEMIAGVLPGPSLFGLFWPGAQQFLFPPDLDGHRDHPDGLAPVRVGLWEESPRRRRAGYGFLKGVTVLHNSRSGSPGEVI